MNAQDFFHSTSQLNPGPSLNPAQGTVSLHMTENSRVPVVAYLNGGAAEVWRFDRGIWGALGSPISGAITKLKLLGGSDLQELFLILEYSGTIEVFKYEFGSWNSYYTVNNIFSSGKISFDAQYDQASNSLYLIYQNAGNLDVVVERITAQNAATVIGTSNYFIAEFMTSFSLMVVNTNSIYFSGTDDVGSIYVVQYSGNNWVDLPSTPQTKGFDKTKLLKASDNLPVLVSTGTNDVFLIKKYNGSTWDNWTPPLPEAVLEWDASINNSNEVILLFLDNIASAFLRKVNLNSELYSESLTNYSNNFDIETNEKGLPYFVCQNDVQDEIIVEYFCFNPITINTPVANITGPICEETPISFSINATANGPFPLSYQWNEYGFPLEDETNATLSLGADFDSYSVNVFDGCRVYYSPEVFVENINPLPNFSEYEPFYSVCSGNQINLSGFPSSYDNLEWYKNDILIAGETDYDLIINPTALSDEGVYVQRAFNACGFRETFPIRLEVDEPIANFTLNQPTVSVCGNRYTIDNLQPVNLRSYRWTSSSAEGRFLPDNQVLNPIYVASPEDLVNGSVTISINSPFSYACGSIQEETFTIQFNNGGLPTLDAGSNIEIVGSTVSLSASVTNAGSINWITGGTGTFDNPAIENPTYTISSEDLADGAVELLIRVDGGTTCSETTLIDTVLLYANAGLSITGNTDEPLSKLVLFKRLNGFVTRFLETTSDGNGDYSFGSLSDGEYYLATFQNNSVYYYGNSYDWSTSTPIILNGNSASGINLPQIPILRGSHTQSINDKYFFGFDLISGIINLRLPTNLRTADGGAEKPLQDATVYLLDADGTTRLDVTTTNEDGVYSFSGLSGATFTIQVEYPGTVYAVTPPSTINTDGDDYTTSLANAAMVKSRASSIFTRPQDTPTAPLFTAWPNPAKDVVYIRSESFGASSIKASIYSSDGRIIKTETITTTQQTLMLDISGLKTSLYYIRLADIDSDQVWALPIWVE